MRNNIFVAGDAGVISYGRVEPHVGFTLERNILVSNGQPVFRGNFGPEGRQIYSDLNLIWDSSGRAPIINGTAIWGQDVGRKVDLTAWREWDYDRHSLIADPGFRNVDKYDFRLSPSSPALALDFKPIEMSDVGPRQPVGPRSRWATGAQ